MLIPSHRHTTEDLALWAEHEAADRVHGMTLDGKIQRSFDCIRLFAERPCYAGVSWGKDSVVLAHLIAISGMQIPCAWFEIVPIANPDCRAVQDAFLGTWHIDYHIIQKSCYHDRHGWHATGTLEAAQRDARRQFGSRYMIGVRADESSIRTLSCRRNGIITDNSCRPLAWWTAQDVMGYLARFDLPTHPVYAMLGSGRYDRWWLRVASLGGRRGDGIGRAQWEREYYGDILRRLEAGIAMVKT
jgi:phosphoadenosine phosphosulfate reductase